MTKFENMSRVSKFGEHLGCSEIGFATSENEPRKLWITAFADHIFRSHTKRLVRRREMPVLPYESAPRYKKQFRDARIRAETHVYKFTEFGSGKNLQARVVVCVTGAANHVLRRLRRRQLFHPRCLFAKIFLEVTESDSSQLQANQI